MGNLAVYEFVVGEDYYQLSQKIGSGASYVCATNFFDDSERSRHFIQCVIMLGGFKQLI